MIKKFKIFENSLYSSLKSIEEESKSEENFDNAVENLKKLIGVDKINYEIEFPYSSRINFSLHFKEKDFVNLIDEYVDEGIFVWCLSINSYYSGYEYYDSSELDYIQNYLSEDSERLIKRLAKLLDVDFKLEDASVINLFDALGDNLIETDYFKNEISYEDTEAVKYNVNKALVNLPFSMSYSNKYDIEINFNIEEIGEYIEKNKLKDINTIKDLIEKIDFSEFSYENLENIWESKYDRDYKSLQKEIKRQLEPLIDKLEEGIDFEYKDPKQLSLFQDVDDETMKKIIKHNQKKYNFQYEIFSKLNIKNLEYAKIVGGKILGWFKSYEFQKNFMKDEKYEDYKKLKETGILHPGIQYQYDYLESVNKYNL